MQQIDRLPKKRNQPHVTLYPSCNQVEEALRDLVPGRPGSCINTLPLQTQAVAGWRVVSGAASAAQTQAQALVGACMGCGSGVGDSLHAGNAMCNVRHACNATPHDCVWGGLLDGSFFALCVMSINKLITVSMLLQLNRLGYFEA